MANTNWNWDYSGGGSGDYKNYMDQATGTGNSANRAATNLQIGFGGPEYLYEMGQGGVSGFFAGILGNHHANSNMTEDVYNSMSAADWSSFSKKGTTDQDIWIEQRAKDMAAQNKADAQEKQQAAQQAQVVTAQNAVIARVTQFAKEMNMSVDELMKNDDFAKGLNQLTQTNSMSQAYGQGLGAGGISAAQTDFNSKQALLGYQQQRMAAGQQANNSAYGMITQQGATANQINQYNQQMNLQLQSLQAGAQAQAYQQGLGQSQNTWGTIGGIVGAVYGGPTGAAAGQKIGAGIGGATYGSYTPYNYSSGYGPSYGGGTTLGGGGGGGNF